MHPMIRLAQVASLESAIARKIERYNSGQCNPLERRGMMSNLEQQLLGCAPAGGCRDMMTSGRYVAVAIGATVAGAAIPVGARQRVDRIVVITSGAAGFELSDFSINNVPQWTQGHIFHSALFAPGGGQNTAFKGDIIGPGSQVTISYTNLDTVATQTLWIALIGPGA